MNSTFDTPESFILDRNSEAAKKALYLGVIETSTRLIPVRATELIQRGDQKEAIVFRSLTKTKTHSFFEKFKQILTTIRAISLTATALPCFALLAEGHNLQLPLQKFSAFSALLGVVLLQIAINLYNDVSDYCKLIDLPGTFGGSGAFDKGWFSAKEINTIARYCAALGVIAGIPALISFPLQILTIGIIGLLGTLFYSHPVYGLKYRALGDITVLLLCGPLLTAGFSIAAFGQLTPAVFFNGGMMGVLACGLLHINNLQDISIDRARGAETLATKIGYNRSIQLLVSMYVFSFGLLCAAVALKTLPITSLIALLAIIPTIKMINSLKKALGPDCPSISLIRIDAAKIHLLSGILLTIGIMLSNLIP